MPRGFLSSGLQQLSPWFYMLSMRAHGLEYLWGQWCLPSASPQPAHWWAGVRSRGVLDVVQTLRQQLKLGDAEAENSNFSLFFWLLFSFFFNCCCLLVCFVLFFLSKSLLIIFSNCVLICYLNMKGNPC